MKYLAKHFKLDHFDSRLAQWAATLLSAIKALYKSAFDCDLTVWYLMRQLIMAAIKYSIVDGLQWLSPYMSVLERQLPERSGDEWSSDPQHLSDDHDRSDKRRTD
ncbi:jg6852 [Pararge aegeria aegeria]|uniref:Jg6852 protein n=1 Tax=Pararge aegeria aegeria TaxID=348720 RepID=A0A8S4S9P1_9NEOP|nr:jg6852 [Pararge aegeria aegeria]